MIRYRQRQFGTVIVFALAGGGAAGLVAAETVPHAAAVALLVAGLCLLCAALFWSLTVEVSETHLRWVFGLGLIAKRVPLAEIAEVEITRTTFWEGWGIHLTRRGWLYNVSGLGAVAIRLKSGKRLLIGSAEPEKLAAALRA